MRTAAALLILVIAGAAFAQDAPASDVAALETAPVMIDGEVLFRLRGNSSLLAERRARDVAAEIEAVARDASIPVSALRLVEAGDRTHILAVERQIVSLFDGDARAEQMTSRQRLAEFYRAAIERAITRYREERTSAYLRAQGIHAAVAVALTIAALLAARWAFDLLAASVENRFRRHLEAVEARSYRVISAEQLRDTVSGVVRAIRFLFRFVVIFACLDYALGLFPWTRPIARYGASLVLDPLRTMGSGVLRALPGLVFIAILVLITRYVLRLTSLFFGGIASGRIRAGRGSTRHGRGRPIACCGSWIIAFAVVARVSLHPGLAIRCVQGRLDLPGRACSRWASSSFVANILAGYMLIYRRAFKEGDRIQVGDVLGDVVTMRQQVTHLRTLKNEEVTIPNSTDPGQRRRQLQLAGARARADPPHDGGDRLRDAVAAGRGDAARGGAAHAGIVARAVAVRAPDRRSAISP